MAAKAPTAPVASTVISKPKMKGRQKPSTTNVTVVKSGPCKTVKVSDQDQASMRQQMSGFLTGKSRSAEKFSNKTGVTDHESDPQTTALDGSVDLEMPVLMTGTEWADSDADIDGNKVSGDVDGDKDLSSDNDDNDESGSGVNISESMVTGASPTWADKVKNIQTGQSTSNKSRTVVGPDSWDAEPLSFGGPAMNHKSKVPPIFLAYK